MKTQMFPEPSAPNLKRRWFSACLALSCVPPLARAASVSGRGVNVIVSPFAAAGGTNDALSRILAEALGRALDESFIVENRPGANATVGTAYVARSKPDGHTLLMGNSASHGTNPTLYRHVPYDAVTDFAPISMVGSAPVVLVVSASLRAGSIADLVAYGKKHPGTLSFGSSGVGSSGHLCGEMFKLATGMDMIHVPYKAEPLAIADVMGGQLAMAFVGPGPATSGVQSGKARAVAVATSERASALPDVPTMTEAGLRDVVFSSWYALFARSGTAPERIASLNGAVKRVLMLDDVRQRMLTLGLEPGSSTPEELKTFTESEIRRLGEIIRKLDITLS